ncbi:hypothetical protein [Embleya sp. NPDC005971]|uniref:hypothetical protein n=1 Tax=Embleya sp. NPDC005971 TaxID=3156724 RepID=UPI0033C70889
MAGYANRTIMLPFPDLSEPGDDVFVVIKNPKTVPLGELTPKNAGAAVVDGQVDMEQAMPAMYAVVAGLVKAWHVYDATSPDDDQPALPLPATAESVAKLPHEITNKIVEMITGTIQSDPS